MKNLTLEQALDEVHQYTDPSWIRILFRKRRRER
jgi:hypothetical protein